MIGDLALIGHPLIGHVVAHRGGHALHARFAQKILDDPEAWNLIESVEEFSEVGHSTVSPDVDSPVPAN